MKTKKFTSVKQMLDYTLGLPPSKGETPLEKARKKQAKKLKSKSKKDVASILT